MSSEEEKTEPSEEPGAAMVATAYHEAGHAVMAVSLGRSIQKATIVAANLQTGGVRLGAVKMQQGRKRATQDWLEDEVLILFAGMVAESHFTGSYCPRGAASDLRAINRLLATRANSERQLEKLHRRLLDKTEHILSDKVHEKAVKSVAQQLLEHQTIKGRLVKHYLNEAVAQSKK
jgi:ATP-dependent Zn protease